MKKLTRNEMKTVMGGYVALPVGCSGSCAYEWTDLQGKKHTTGGSCSSNTGSGGLCYCSNGVGSCSSAT